MVRLESLPCMVTVMLAVGLVLPPAGHIAAQMDPFAGLPPGAPAALPAAATQPGGAAITPRLSSGVAGGAASQAGPQGPVIAQVQFNEEDINLVFQVISDASGWSIFPSGKARGKISLYAKNITAGQLLEQAVNMAGLVSVRQGNVISVMTYDEYVQYYGVQKQVIRLAQRDAEEILRAVSPFVTAHGRLIADPATRSIIIYDAPNNLPLLERVIQEVDQPASQMSIEVVKLVYADVLGPQPRVGGDLRAGQDGPRGFPATRHGRDLSTESDLNVRGSLVGPDGGAVPDCADEPHRTEGLPAGPGTGQDVGRITRRGAGGHGDDQLPGVQRGGRRPGGQPAAVTGDCRGRRDLRRLRRRAGGGAAGRSGGSRDSRMSNNRIRVGVLAGSNAIVVTAPSVVHQQVKQFLAICDVPPLASAGGIQVYKLQNASAKQVADVLQQLIDQDGRSQEASRSGMGGHNGTGVGVGASGPMSPASTWLGGNGGMAAGGPPQVGSATGGPSQGGGGGGSAVAPMGGPYGSYSGSSEGGVPWVEKPRVVADEATNSVVVQASVQDQSQLGALIQELDRRCSQVLLEVVVVEIRGTEDLDVGLEWECLDAPDSHWGHLVFTSFGLSVLDPATGHRMPNVLPGGTAAVVRSDYVPVILYAFANSGKASIRTAPRILVNDNAKGEIQSIDEEPYKQVNASSTVATTSFGGFVQAGTQLQVTPSISHNDYLRLQYQIELNTFRGGSADPTLPPARYTNSISSEATVPDGNSLVVGGLTYRNKRDSVDKLPLLGDIPLAGYLFRHTSTTEEDVRLYVFVTPRILRDEEFRDLKDISRQQRLEAKEPSPGPSNGPVDLPAEEG